MTWRQRAGGSTVTLAARNDRLRTDVDVRGIDLLDSRLTILLASACSQVYCAVRRKFYCGIDVPPPRRTMTKFKA